MSGQMVPESDFFGTEFDHSYDHFKQARARLRHLRRHRNQYTRTSFVPALLTELFETTVLTSVNGSPLMQYTSSSGWVALLLDRFRPCCTLPFQKTWP